MQILFLIFSVLVIGSYSREFQPGEQLIYQSERNKEEDPLKYKPEVRQAANGELVLSFGENEEQARLQRDMKGRLGMFPYLYVTYTTFSFVDNIVKTKSQTNNDVLPQILLIGLGGGTFAKYIAERLLCNITIIEIDSEVIEIAKKYFQVEESEYLHIVHENAFDFVQTSSYIQYDYIFSDAFDADSIPEQLQTVEYISNLKRLLNPGGLIAINIAILEPPPSSPKYHAAHIELLNSFYTDTVLKYMEWFEHKFNLFMVSNAQFIITYPSSLSYVEMKQKVEKNSEVLDPIYDYVARFNSSYLESFPDLIARAGEIEVVTSLIIKNYHKTRRSLKIFWETNPRIDLVKNRCVDNSYPISSHISTLKYVGAIQYQHFDNVSTLVSHVFLAVSVTANGVKVVHCYQVKNVNDVWEIN